MYLADQRTPEYEEYVSAQLTYDAHILAGTATRDQAQEVTRTRTLAAQAAKRATYSTGDDLPEYTVTVTDYYRVRAHSAREAEATYLTRGVKVDQDLPRATVED